MEFMLEHVPPESVNANAGWYHHKCSKS